jgi:hypothetical protein
MAGDRRAAFEREVYNHLKGVHGYNAIEMEHPFESDPLPEFHQQVHEEAMKPAGLTISEEGAHPHGFWYGEVPPHHVSDLRSG